MRRFAEARGQDIYVFPAGHTRTKRKQRGLPIDLLLRTQDGDGNAKGPGLFLYTQGMPITILYNICTPLGLVNGARGTAAGIVPDPDGRLSFTFCRLSFTSGAFALRCCNITTQPSSSDSTETSCYAPIPPSACSSNARWSSTNPSRRSKVTASPSSPLPSPSEWRICGSRDIKFPCLLPSPSRSTRSRGRLTGPRCLTYLGKRTPGGRTPFTPDIAPPMSNCPG
jgi:hypothetical protein